MKNKFLAMILLLFLVACPVYANTPYTIILNGLDYVPKHTMYQSDQTLYISSDDFTSLTYSTVTSEDKTYVLTTQNHMIKFTINDRIAYINGKLTILKSAALMLNDQLYLPVNILDYTNYPYTLSDDNFTLTINPLLPYSKSSDSYHSHLFMDTKIEDLSASLKTLVPAEYAAQLLTEARKKDDYISFIDNTDKEDLLNLMNANLLKGKPIQVSFREVDLLSATPKVSVLNQLPVQLTIDSDSLMAKIGEDELFYNCIWAAYMPSNTDLKIDVSKSLDATLMRMLYEYYRDQNDLKDDLYFSPVVTIKNTRSNSVSYTAYSDHMMGQDHVYDIIIYKTIDEKQITYVVDFILHTTE